MKPIPNRQTSVAASTHAMRLPVTPLVTGALS